MFGLYNAEADRIKIVTLLSHIRDSSLVEDKEEALKSLSDIAKKNPLVRFFSKRKNKREKKAEISVWTKIASFFTIFSLVF